MRKFIDIFVFKFEVAGFRLVWYFSLGAFGECQMRWVPCCIMGNPAGQLVAGSRRESWPARVAWSIIRHTRPQDHGYQFAIAPPLAVPPPQCFICEPVMGRICPKVTLTYSAVNATCWIPFTQAHRPVSKNLGKEDVYEVLISQPHR